MARIEINLPDKYAFSTSIPIRIGDINRGFHVGHVTLLSLLEEARTQFFLSKGNAEQVNVNRGIGFIVGDIGIIYKRQVRYGQKVLVEIAAADLKNKSFDLVYRLSDADTGEEIARAKTGLLIFDYQTQKVVPIPEDFKARLLK